VDGGRPEWAAQGERPPVAHLSDTANLIAASCRIALHSASTGRKADLVATPPEIWNLVVDVVK